MQLASSCNFPVPIALIIGLSIPAIGAAPAERFREFLRAKGMERILDDQAVPMKKQTRSSRRAMVAAPDWDAPFSPKGVYGEVYTFDAQDGTVAVGGDVRGVDGISANGIALWADNRWTALGNGLGGSRGHATVHRVRLSGKKVFALSQSGNLTLDGRAFDAVRWDGSSWTGWNLDSGAIAYDVLEWNNRMIIGTTSGVWEADSSGLRQLGNNLDGDVHEIGEKGEELWVAGKFILGPDSVLHNFARWTGSTWIGLANPRSAHILDFEWHGDELFSIESYRDNVWGPVGTEALLRWNGSKWDTPPVASQISRNFSLGGDLSRLYLLGWEKGISTLLKWNGAAFQYETAFNDPLHGYYDLKFDADRLYLGGGVFGIDSVRADGIAAWDGVRWLPLSRAENLGPSFGIFRHFPILASNGGKLYFGGDEIGFAGNKPASGLASWDGSSLDNMGGGLNTSRGPRGIFMEVQAFAFRGDSVFVGGAFDSAGTKEARNIALWDGSNWNTLGTGYPGKVMDILVEGKDVFIAGKPDTSPAPGSNPLLAGQVLGRWDGAAWHRSGEGITGLVNQSIVYEDIMYIGGEFFLPADSNSCAFARWDGSSWIPILRSSKRFTSHYLDGMVIHQDLLFIGGRFTDTTNGQFYQLATWNGSVLAPFDSIRLMGSGRTMVSASSRLFVVGTLKSRSDRLIYWDGRQWHTLSDDLNMSPSSLAEYKGDLFACGQVPNYNGKASHYLVKWRIPGSNEVAPRALSKRVSRPRLVFKDGVLQVDANDGGVVHDLRGKRFPIGNSRSH